MLSFDEGNYLWRMVLVYHPDKAKGAFWFLPHDNENTAFDSAVYAVQKYGGGFLAIKSQNKRFFNGQDPNRNFGESQSTAKTCKQQKYPAPKYSKNIFKIIDTFRKAGTPYLALHNNKDGWYGNGGSGGVSILNSSVITRSFPSGKVVSGQSKGIKDEDSLIYIAGKNKSPAQSKLKSLIDAGIYVKYEVVSNKKNDCFVSS